MYPINIPEITQRAYEKLGTPIQIPGYSELNQQNQDEISEETITKSRINALQVNHDSSAPYSPYDQFHEFYY